MYFGTIITCCSRLFLPPEQVLLCCIKTCATEIIVSDALLCVFYFTNKISQ